MVSIRCQGKIHLSKTWDCVSANKPGDKSVMLFPWQWQQTKVSQAALEAHVLGRVTITVAVRVSGHYSCGSVSCGQHTVQDTATVCGKIQ